MSFTTNNANARLTCDRCGYSKFYYATSVASCLRQARDDGFVLKLKGGSVLNGACVCGDCITIMKKRMEESE